MRVLMTVFANSSHLYNMVPLAWALTTAGHEVRIASHPDNAQAISDCGLTAVPVGNDLNIMQLARSTPREEMANGGALTLNETRPEKLTWDYVHDTFAQHAQIYDYMADRAMTDQLVEHARQWQPDLVVWDALTYAGPIAAAAAGVPHVRILFGLDHIGRMRGVFHRLAEQQPAENRHDPFADWLGAKGDPYGVAFDETLATGQTSLAVAPPWMSFPTGLPTISMRHIPFNGPAVVPDWLREPTDRPRICLTLGLTLREIADENVSLADFVHAVADIDAEVVATLSVEQLAEIGELPDNVRAVDYVPLHALLPTCSALVHHGGGGTRTNALQHGVPQLIVPNWLWDEHDTAHRFAERGAALVTETADLTPERLREQLRLLLSDPSFQAAADEIQKEYLALPSPNATVVELERIAEHGRTS
ncbi:MULTISPECIES: activator-dependent family glycosyltransferase [unclassified Streptomyces]|uniref:activator-dependent family glycosyltransferase n=1 Tax=unclassified Streptomyces TaxID=2593676 RepID=UPI000B50CF68|nr:MULTISPECIES: activator-dependent family glycosyltransferase [unclassified Streptomyces]MYX03006.1 activator-dependent family glycosyltransferase [Streptomyces sp. SID8378]SNB89332.1 L-desosaminyltransferase [Streptomyces sp. PgraA7]